MTTQSITTPVAEVPINEPLIRRLLEEQHPSFSNQALVHGADGWDNSTWRLGEHHAVRLPRRHTAVQCLENEQRWLPIVGSQLSIDTPIPVATGRPNDRYPWPWSIVPWFDASTAAEQPLPSSKAEHLASVLREIHRPAPADAPPNPYRGVPLQDRRLAFEERLCRLERQLGDQFQTSGLDPDHLRSLFSRGEQSAWEQPPVWLHGDLHPKNILVAHRQLAALIDWGDITAGDPASDLACVWMLFPRKAHAAFWQAYGVQDSDRLKERSRAWAILFGLLFLSVGLKDDPEFAAIGARTLDRASSPSRL